MKPKSPPFLPLLLLSTTLLLTSHAAITTLSTLSLNSTQSALITCSTASSSIGFSVKPLGDLNNDGYNDFAVSSPSFKSNQGLIAIVYGTGIGVPTLDICTNTDPTKSYRILGEASPYLGSNFGSSFAAIGDVNGDGIPDIAIGANNYNGGQGKVYVVFLPRTASAVESTIWATPSSTQGFIVTTTNTASLGFAVSAPGDVNNDTIPDVLIGAPGYNNNAGLVVVIYGTNTSSTVNPVVETLTASLGYTINGVEGQQLGYAVHGAGDLNNDTITDFLVSAPVGKKVYLVYGASGKTRTVMAAASLGTNGLTWANSVRQMGTSLSTGDFDNDGFRDVLIGSVENVYLIFGKTLKNVTDVEAVNSTLVFKINTNGATSGIGKALSLKGDVNGDGFIDLMIPAAGLGSTMNGTVYVLYGGSSLSGTFNLDNMESTQGVMINGPAASSQFGYSVDDGYDLNKDGIYDMIISAPNADSAGGRVYVIYGSCSAQGYAMANGKCTKSAVTTPTTPTKTGGTTTVVQKTINQKWYQNLSGGQIAGIAVGCFVFFILILVALKICWTRGTYNEAKPVAMTPGSAHFGDMSAYSNNSGVHLQNNSVQMQSNYGNNSAYGYNNRV